MIDRIGAWVSALSIEDIPARVIEKIRLQIATSISAAASSPWHEPALKVAKTLSPGDALVFATRQRLRPEDAAFANTAFAMSLDFDDYMLSGHTGHSAVIVPLAFADSLDQVVTAAAAANEIMGRLSTMCFIGPLNGQMSSYIHNIGAAISCGKVMGLEAEEMSAAIALSLYQPNYCLAPGFWNEDSKTLTAAFPQRQGVMAARLAQAGLDGARDLLDEDLGFFSIFSFTRFPGLMDGLGKIWFSDTLCYKRYPGTSYISAPVEAVLRCSGGRCFRADEIDSVRVETTLLSATVDRLGARALQRSPLDANAVNFSVRLSVAAALRFGDLIPEILRPEQLAEEENELRAIAEKITVVHDWSQSIRLINSSPVGMRMIAHLRLSEILRVMGHVRTMNRASGEKGGGKSCFSQGWSALLPLLGRMLKARFEPVSALDFDPTCFRMLQSARTVFRTLEGQMEESVEIPQGACGRDMEEAISLVRWRCELAFGDKGERLLEVVLQDGQTVEDLYAVLEQD